MRRDSKVNEPVLTTYAQVNTIYHRWNKERNEEVFEIIDVLQSDCEAQSECLQSNQDVKWDCYDHDNWDDMVDSLKKIKKILIKREWGRWQKDMNVNKFMEKHNENKTETTREFGKEL